jgi:hypothetical protein
MVVSLPMLSALVDRIRPNILVPLAFLFRFLAILTFLFYIKTPNTLGVNLVCFSVIAFGMLENIAITALFLRGMPNDVRGTMIGALHFFGQVGQITFTYLAYYAIEKNKGAKAPFKIVCAADLGIFLIGLTLSCLGYLKN